MEIYFAVLSLCRVKINWRPTVIAIKQGLDIPIKMIGVGEGIDDLRPFDAREFADALFVKDNQAAEQAG